MKDRHIIFAVVEHEKEIMKNTTEWGVLAPLAKYYPIVFLEKGSAPLITLIKERLKLKPAFYYVTMKDHKSYVKKDSFYKKNGFKRDGIFGGEAIFEAFEEAGPGLTKVDVEGDTFYAFKESFSLNLLEWRCYKKGSAFLITSKTNISLPDWAYICSFYARRKPTKSSTQLASLKLD